MSDAVRRQDTAAANDLLDTDALLARLSAGVNAPPDFQAGFKSEFPAQAQSIMAFLVKAGGGNSGSYHLLRVRHVDGETHILFRIVAKAGGVNYHDWVAGKDAQGHLKFQDAYLATGGELMSQSMRRLYIQAVLAANPGFLDRLSGKDKQFAATISDLARMGKAVQSAQYQSVLDIYKALPASLQEDKGCMIVRLQATAKLRKQSPQDYSAAMADYKRLFPEDHSVDINCLDALFEARQFAEARRSLDRIDAFTGGDPYQLVVRGNTYKLEGGDDNLRLARTYYRAAVDQEPDLAPAYWALVSLSLDARQYDQTAALLTTLRRDLHVKIKDLTTVPTYAGFVKSDAYKNWIAGQTLDKPTTRAQ